MASQYVEVEPLIDMREPLHGLDELPVLEWVHLAGIAGGRFVNHIFPGQDTFQGVREYSVGDDVRNIDSVLTAANHDKTPIVRYYSASVRPNLWIVTDTLKKHHTGQDGYYDKRGLATSAIFALLKTALRRDYQMPTTVIAANDRNVYNSGYPRAGMGHLIDLAENLQNLVAIKEDTKDNSEETTLSELLNTVGRIALRSVVAVVSDFRGMHVQPDHPEDNWKSGLEQIANQHNAIVAIEITSPEDKVIPHYVHNIGYSPRGRVWAGRDGKRFRKAYTQIVERQQTDITNALDVVGAAHIRLTTDNPQWLTSLNAQLLDPAERVYPE